MFTIKKQSLFKNKYILFEFYIHKVLFKMCKLYTIF